MVRFFLENSQVGFLAEAGRAVENTLRDVKSFALEPAILCGSDSDAGGGCPTIPSEKHLHLAATSMEGIS